MINKRIESKLSEAFDEFKGFYAFSKEQLDQSLAKFGIEAKDCCSLGGGLICPKENAQALIDRMNTIVETATREVLEERTPDEIIEYELANHESWYTWDTSNAYEALSNFRELDPEAFSIENVRRVFREVAHKYEDC